MFAFLLRSIFGPPRPQRRPFIDPILGELQPDEEGWTVSVRKGSDSFHFDIGGDEFPDASLLAHAHEIFQNYSSFKAAVRNCIDLESREYPDHAKTELAALEIDFVSLDSPLHPNDGMIFFRSPTETFRLWRCDYINREPVHLGCDT